MKFGSLFSGIGGIDLGLERAGMECAWQVEIDPYRRAVLARHWPNMRRYEDVKGCRGANALGLSKATYTQGEKSTIGRRAGRRATQPNVLDPVDLICGGFPCQDVSTAGKRKGLRASRSGLFFEFVRIVGEVRPRWILVENVSGLYSSNEGKDFDTVIETLAECGYGLAWRVLDSQYFGVPQRRRRVFIVGCLGTPCPPAVLFESKGGERCPTEGREAGKRITAPLIGGSGSGGIRRAASGQADEASYYIPEVGYALNAHKGATRRLDGESETFIVKTAHTKENAYGWRQGATYALEAGCQSQAICTSTDADRMRETTRNPRRLDGRRYAALGDAVTTNVAEWIGKRIMAVDAKQRDQ